MRLSYVAALAIATFISAATASPFSPVLEKRAASCKNDNDCPGKDGCCCLIHLL
ncbi:hypothetical protein K450DRAFT_216785 [Umbelopsis ramanniana AG]|uniref:Uncharacterized protein n=1 Tax=Umbelopsis ramanniana AG TaxID=1314678 RepID=A0AAD5HIY5_UMBRA|nr:uncharacterized protein K450DRAFT_216785 [Umbelopsis ramanniana AG]KAI8584534.1 hypothetical protein K450DRAFT_216785 [Umbelopsis ramanniana AG]